jgi:hypothetical protein
MRDWLTIELVLGALLVTSFTCVGLVALWAATAPRHWFLRTAVVLAVLSPLLAVPAYEPFLVFAIQACVIVAGVKLRPWAQRFALKYVPKVQLKPAERSRPRPLRFALRMLLYATPAVAVLALLLPLLFPESYDLRPIFAVLIVYVFESVIILALILVVCWLSRIRFRRIETEKQNVQLTDERNRRATFRFSLKTLLLITPIVAVAAAMVARVAMYMPAQNFESWTTIVVDGTAVGIPVLLGGWMAVVQRKGFTWPAAIVLSLLLVLVAASYDWFAVSILWNFGWPPNPANWQTQLSTSPEFATMVQRRVTFIWLGVVIGLSLLTCFCGVAALAATRPTQVGNESQLSKRTWPARRIIASSVLASVILLLVALPSFIVWQLLHQSPLPRVSTPNPNGFDDVAAAGDALDTSPILNTSIEPPSTTALKAEVVKYAAAYAQLHQGLSRDVRLPLWPSRADLINGYNKSYKEIQQVRSASRGLMREAELARREGRFSDAAKLSLDCVRLGQESARDGTNIEYLVGIAIEGIGHESLFAALPRFDKATCLQVIHSLSQADQSRELLTDVLRRDRIWSENAYGWYGHLHDLLYRAVDTEQQRNSHMWSAMNRTQAVTRMLIIELALRAYFLEYGELPENLSYLVPDFIPTIPLDPCDPTGGVLRYDRKPDGHIVYSVGADGEDNQGRSTERTSGLWGDGEDLRLDVYLAPWDIGAPGGTSANQGGSQSAGNTEENNSVDQPPDQPDK